MSTQNLAQRSVHQVRCGVVQTNTCTANFINVSLNALTHFQRAGNQFALVTNRLTVFLGVADAKAKAVAFQFALIANLTAGFRIEWRLIQHDHSFLACIDGINRFTINKQRGHFAVQFQVVVAFKFRSTINADHCVVVSAKTAGFTRTTTLLFHRSFKARFVNFDVALTANVEAPIKEHADIVLDYGVGVESVDFVTLGVEVLVEYLVLFGIYGGQARGTIDAKGVAQRLDDLREAIQANAVMCKTAEAYVQDHMLELSEHMPAMVVGNGPNYGVAEEAALKLSETIKIPAMHHEGEEFVHGPEMQIVPGYLVFIVDDPQGSERLANIADALSNVTTKTVLLTAHPKGRAHEVAVPQVAPLLSAIPNLVFFQTIAAIIAERLKSWDVHPYLDAVSKQMEVKAEGYEESVNALKAKAAECYGM